MVAYVLPADANRTAIADGRRHVLLARPIRTRTPRNGGHAGDGARIHLRTPATGKRPQHTFPTARCALSAEVTFSHDGVVRIINATVAAWSADRDALNRRGEGVLNTLLTAERGSTQTNRAAAADRFAIAAGFKDYAALWASIRASDGEVIARQVIAWLMP